MLIHLSGCVQETTIRPVFLPRPDPGEEEVWTFRLEHSVWVQWDRPQDLCTAATHVPGAVPGCYFSHFFSLLFFSVTELKLAIRNTIRCLPSRKTHVLSYILYRRWYELIYLWLNLWLLHPDAPPPSTPTYIFNIRAHNRNSGFHKWVPLHSSIHFHQLYSKTLLTFFHKQIALQPATIPRSSAVKKWQE